MNFFIRYNNQNIGPFSEDQIVNLLQQGRFNSSVLFSTDLSRWYQPCEIPAFKDIALPAAPATMENDSKSHGKGATRGSSGKAPKDHAVLFFFLFCILVFIGFGFIIFLISMSDGNSDGDTLDTQVTVAGNIGGSLAAVYQKKQQAIGLVILTIEDPRGNTYPIDIGTAFATSKTLFVTNAHVAYAVKNTFEDSFVPSVIRAVFENEARNRNMSLNSYIQELSERAFEQKRTEILNRLKDFRVRDVTIRLNHSNGRDYKVSRIQVHPHYNPGEKQKGEFDVAIFEIDGRVDCYWEIASKKELHSLCAGMPVASAGFPSEGLDDLNIDKPEASYASGDIKKITDFDNKDAGPDYNRSIFHSIPAAGGASGSPIFTANGKVIAVLWGGASQLDLLGNRISSGVLQNYGVRIDQINDMGNPISWENWVNAPTQHTR